LFKKKDKFWYHGAADKSNEVASVNVIGRARSLSRPFVFLLCLAWAGCQEVSGGAVEAGWDLRDPQGNRLSCQDAKISSIRFTLKPTDGGADPCVADSRCTFPCDKGVGNNPRIGTTPFIIPEGAYAISLSPLDQEGKVLDYSDGFVVPTPVVRDVHTGELTELSVNMIIVRR
jgi:hypothetical protein